MSSVILMPSNLSDITHQQSSSITSLELCQHPCCPRTQESCSTQELATWCSLSLECDFLTTPTPPIYLSRSLLQFLYSNVKFSSVTFCYVKCKSPIPTLEIASLLLCLKGEGEVAQSCLTLCSPMDCRLPGSFIHGIFQARVLEWVAISFSRGYYLPPKHLPKANILGLPGGSVVKNLPAKQKMVVQPLHQEDPLQKEIATHASILALDTSKRNLTE